MFMRVNADRLSQMFQEWICLQCKNSHSVALALTLVNYCPPSLQKLIHMYVCILICVSHPLKGRCDGGDLHCKVLNAKSNQTQGVLQVVVDKCGDNCLLLTKPTHTTATKYLFKFHLMPAVPVCVYVALFVCVCHGLDVGGWVRLYLWISTINRTKVLSMLFLCVFFVSGLLFSSWCVRACVCIFMIA